MSKLQPTKFRSVAEMLDFIPGRERKIVEYLRALVFECIPECEEKLAYNVPFYYRHSRICYIWPASVPWGGIKEGVAIGFCRGHMLRDDMQYLEQGDRKEVCTKTFTAIRQIEPDVLKVYLFEAKDVDEKIRNS
ncbi:DUF1801 domain-containing protein [Aliifodinibius sp. S!AR15-10]|uniref:DUF1801 domain-containing protein n=1 Tax=Aliifodinibius sp. S!AR15-10 TaxID=2950437 RepID=UPI00285C7EBC|nr:DUF1801 domain-containing protein [Aliifodinibius sp. S!AR15-10]MDR8391690.1 DUF1801 domain-containing protein [Aliifodinibius sp. S!AR15-10]